MLMIAAGYEDGNDADSLRADPMFKLALDRLPSDEELCSQSTISRLENLPDARALLRLERALIEQYCASFRRAPKRIVLDVDDTFDRVHGGQQLRLFNAFHDDYGFQPIVRTSTSKLAVIHSELSPEVVVRRHLRASPPHRRPSSASSRPHRR
jgi:hypothetical protein